jgi:hypothetical protein
MRPNPHTSVGLPHLTEGVDGNEDRSSLGIDLVRLVSLTQSVQNGWLIEVCEACEVRDSIQDRRIGWRQIPRWH